MVVYGEGRYRCATHGLVRPGPRRPDDLDAGRYEPGCPECGGRLVGEAIPEDHWLDPRNVYATTKLAQEGLCNAYAREHDGCVATLLRYHNVYGPRMPRDTPYAGVASLFRSAYERGEAPRVLRGRSHSCATSSTSTDVAHANVLALTDDEAVAGPLNVCSGTPHTILDLAEALRPDGGPAPEVVGGYRLGDIRHVFASPDACRAAARVPRGRRVRGRRCASSPRTELRRTRRARPAVLRDRADRRRHHFVTSAACSTIAHAACTPDPRRAAASRPRPTTSGPRSRS